MLCRRTISCSLDPFHSCCRALSRPNGVHISRTDCCTVTVRLWHGQRLHSLSESVICTYSVGQSIAQRRGCRSTLLLPAWGNALASCLTHLSFHASSRLANNPVSRSGHISLPSSGSSHLSMLYSALPARSSRSTTCLLG